MDIAALRAEQRQRAAEVVRQDDFDVLPPRFIGGADVGFEQEGAVTRAALVILEYPSMKLVEYRIARIDTTMPYSLSVSIRPCWRPGTCWSRSPICYLSMVMVSHIRAGLVSRRILG